MAEQKRSPFLGDMMIDLELVTPEEIRLALLGCKQTGLPLGLQLIIQDTLDFDTLRLLVIAQSFIRDDAITLESARKAIALSRKKAVPLKIALDFLRCPFNPVLKNRLGNLLVESLLVDHKLIKQRLAVSTMTGLPLGKVLVASRDLTPNIIEKVTDLQSLIRSKRLTREMAIEEVLTATKNQEENSGDYKPSQACLLGDLLIDSGITSQEDIDAALAKGRSDNQRLGEAMVALNIAAQDVINLSLELQQLVRAKKFSHVYAADVLARATSGHYRPKRADSLELRTLISFEQFLRLVRIIDGSGRITLEQDGQLKKQPTVDNFDDETWVRLVAMPKEAQNFARVVPPDVQKCLEKNGFVSPEQQLSVARAARQFKLLRERAITLEQALVCYHKAQIDEEGLQEWSGTFPALPKWQAGKNDV